jgi:hypothetical protein
MGRFEEALKASLKLTRNHFSTHALAQRNQILALEEREKWSECSRECLSRGWSYMSEEGEGGFYTNPEKLAVTVQDCVSSVLPTRCQNYRGVSLKPNSEGLSVVPTPGRYYRAPG